MAALILQTALFAAAAATSVVASIGVQPIEKKLTMDQMLESEVFEHRPSGFSIEIRQ